MKDKSEWLKQSDMARSCGVSVQAFQKWKVATVAKQGRSVFYTFADVLENRLAHQKSQLGKQAEPATDKEQTQAEREAKLRLTQAQAEYQEIKNSQLRKELAPVAVLEWTLGRVGSQIAAILEAIPSRLKKRNPKLTATDIHLITREIVKTQNAAAKVQVDFDEFERNA